VEGVDGGFAANHPLLEILNACHSERNPETSGCSEEFIIRLIFFTDNSDKKLITF